MKAADFVQWESNKFRLLMIPLRKSRSRNLIHLEIFLIHLKDRGSKRNKKPWRNEEGFVMGMKYFLLNADSLEF